MVTLFTLIKPMYIFTHASNFESNYKNKNFTIYYKIIENFATKNFKVSVIQIAL